MGQKGKAFLGSPRGTGSGHEPEPHSQEEASLRPNLQSEGVAQVSLHVFCTFPVQLCPRQGGLIGIILRHIVNYCIVL